MNQRQKQLLRLIIEEYIKCAQPIGSEVLVKKYKLKTSPATVRNDMVQLEDEGYLYQPHTSAGRLPTEAGYRFYIKNFLAPVRPRKKAKETLERAAAKQENKQEVKQLVKSLAQLSGGTAVLSFDDGNMYFTGIANLFSQPEFFRQETVISFSENFDDFEQILSEMAEDMKDDIKILIGEESPLGREISTLLAPCRFQSGKRGILGILGPQRMDYSQNVGLLEYVQDLFFDL